MEKEALRRQMIQRLKEFSGEERMRAEKQLVQLLVKSAVWQRACCVALTVSLPFEIDTSPLIQQAWKEGKRVVVPVIGRENAMKFCAITPQTMWQISSFHTKEPVERSFVAKEAIDLLVVPGVVFHEEGYRIGFGKGFYDRYLTDFRGNTASLAFSWQISQQWQPESFDQKVQQLYVVAV